MRTRLELHAIRSPYAIPNASAPRIKLAQLQILQMTLADLIMRERSLLGIQANGVN
jgi:hypothetical protein